MSKLSVSCLLGVLVVLWSAPSSAQTPAQGMWAAGADVGVIFPAEEFENTITFDGFGEYYLTPRISLRGLFGYLSPGVDGRTEDHFRQVRLVFNGVYNWEFGEWHPYATAGAGFYFTRLLLDGRDDPDGDVRGGLNFGGGIEYFLSNEASIKGELRFDIVSHPALHPDATTTALTIGYKRYF